MLIDGTTVSALARRVVVTAAIGAVSLLAAGAAQAYQTAPGWVASDYVTGFDHGSGAGPVGLAFDSTGNLLVSAVATASLHKAPPGGGTAAATKIRDGYGQAAGLAFDKSGRLYMARGTQHDVVELNPASGEVMRTVVANLPCPVGLATDPVSGDLFVSNVFCAGGGIMRITGFAGGGPGKATRYAGTQDADGLTFAPDGTLYAAGGARIVRIAGTNSGNAGAVSTVVELPNVDGIAYAPATTQEGEYLVVVRTDGEIDRIDPGGNVTPVLTGASRGDLVTVGPDRCVYADLQDRVIKLSPATGTCAFATPLGEQSVLSQRAGDRVVDTAVKARAPKAVKRLSRFDLKVKATNKSANVAHTVVITNTLPKGVKLTKTRAARGVNCKRRGRIVTCRKATLAARKSFTVTLRVKSLSGKAYTNGAKVKSNDLDPAPGNNRSKSKTKVKRR
jgi:Domain of unknown function DUF11